MIVQNVQQQEQAGVGTSWTELFRMSPDQSADKVLSVFEHIGDSDLADFRIQYVWSKTKDTKPATMKVETGLAHDDEAMPTKGDKDGAIEVIVEAKAQANTVDVRTTMLLMRKQ